MYVSCRTSDRLCFEGRSVERLQAAVHRQDESRPVSSFTLCSLHDWKYQAFYRTMHYSAKCDIEIACRTSVRLSVTLVDQDHKLEIFGN